MKAAVLHALGEVPRLEEFADAVAREGEIPLELTAAVLDNATKVIAAGTHFARAARLPFRPARWFAGDRRRIDVAGE
jgi:hypothetical protein